jgi:hypothetical protein
VRYWSTPDGKLLVEKEEGFFLRLTSEGKLDGFFKSGQSSVQEYLNTTTYAVEGGRLVSTFVAENWDTLRESASRNVEVDGLVEARPEDWPRAVEAARAFKC